MQDSYETFRQILIRNGGNMTQVQAFDVPSDEDFIRVTIGDKSWDIHDMADLLDRLDGHYAPNQTTIEIQEAIHAAR